MAIRTGILFCTLFLGALALPTQLEDGDIASFFETESGGQGRIVGGRVAGPHPWLVSLTSGGATRNHFCGGSIINRRTILTAAHCLWRTNVGEINWQLDTLRVNAGTNRFRTGGQSMTVQGISLHPQYRHVTPPRHDVATLFTVDLLTFNELVVPVSISWNHVGAGVNSRVAGWGSYFAPGSPVSAQLLEIDAVTITGPVCAQRIRHNIVDEIELCTSNPVYRGICTGDSGGPLMRSDTNQQIGIASWISGCGQGFPDVFVRIGAFRSWIEENTQAE